MSRSPPRIVHQGIRRPTLDASSPVAHRGLLAPDSKTLNQQQEIAPLLNSNDIDQTANLQPVVHEKDEWECHRLHDLDLLRLEGTLVSFKAMMGQSLETKIHGGMHAASHTIRKSMRPTTLLLGVRGSTTPINDQDSTFGDYHRCRNINARHCHLNV